MFLVLTASIPDSKRVGRMETCPLISVANKFSWQQQLCTRCL